MVYGRTPFADLPFIPKMNAICNTQVWNLYLHISHSVIQVWA